MNYRCMIIGSVILVTWFSSATADEQPQHTATVSFTNASSYSDFGSADYGPQQGQAELQQVLRKTISQLADDYLPAEQSLQIEFTDIDMAGRLVPGHQTANMPGRSIPFNNPDTWQRIVDRDEPPMLQFNYSLSMDTDDALKMQQVKLHDYAFLSTIRTRQRQHVHTELAFETMMLKDWFRETFTTD